MRSYISMTQQRSPSSQPSQLPSLPPISVIYTEFPQTWIHKYTHTKSAEACCVFTKLASVLHIIVVSDTKMFFFFFNNQYLLPSLHSFHPRVWPLLSRRGRFWEYMDCCHQKWRPKRSRLCAFRIIFRR